MKKFQLTIGNYRYWEYFDKVQNLKYFKMGGAHEIYKLKNIEGPAIFCYCELYGFLDFLKKNCVNCPLKKTYYFNFDIQEDDVPDRFYDWRCYEEILDNPFCQVLVNREVAGIACKKLKILHLTDWSHTRKGASLLDKFIEEVIVPEWGLSPISLSSIGSITLGADVEFEELDSFSEYKPIPTSVIDSLEEQIGRDGAGDQVELRPSPSEKPIKIIKEIKNLLKQIRDIPLSWKGDEYPLGAHIHIGLPMELRNTKNFVTISEFLDELIGKYVINLSGKARGKYKVLTAWEEKPWGFEYRSMPSYIFSTPKLGYLILKLIKKGVEEFIKKGEIEIQGGVMDWKRYLSEKEILELMSFLENQSEVHFLINKNWKIKPKKNIKIIFQDDWSEEVKKFVEGLISKNQKFFLKQGIKSVVLFGFKKERGLVSNIPLKDCSVIEGWKPLGSSKLKVGFPYEFRVTELNKEVKNQWKNWIKDIVKFIKFIKEVKSCA